MPRGKVLYFLKYAMMEHPATTNPGQPRDVSITMTRVNLMALPVALATLILCGGPFVALYGWSAVRLSVRYFLVDAWITVPALLAGFVLHELIHGAAWAYYGRKSLTIIRFGINWKALAPYAHCPEPMDAGAYRLGAAAPGVLLGLVPIGIATWVGPTWLFFPGMLLSLAAAGDVLILWVLRKIPSRLLVQDHPTRAGCLVYDLPTTEESPK
jgi:hypothetical protein